MAFCSSCGGQVPAGANACPACGARQAIGTTTAGGAVAVQAPSTAMSDNVAGLLAYITIIPAIIFLVVEPYNRSRFIRFHAFQNIFLHVAAFVLWIALFVASMILGMIPIIGHIIGFLLWLALSIGLFVVWVMCLIKANQGQMWKLPVIGDMAEKQAGA